MGVIAETQSFVQGPPPWWFLAVVGACVPVTIVALVRMGRWWLSARPLPLPDDGAWPAVRWPAWAGLCVFGLIVILTHVLIPLAYLALRDVGLLPWEPLEVPRMFSPAVFAAMILAPLAGLALCRLFGRGSPASIGVRAGCPGRAVIVGVVTLAVVLPLCVVALWVNTALAGLMQVELRLHPLLETIHEAPGAWVLPLAVVQAGILAPLSEEFTYRGVLMTALMKTIGPGGAIFTSSALFAAMHLTAEPQAVLPLFILALGLGYAAYRTRSLLAPVITHGLFNALMLAVSFSVNPAG